MRYVVLSKKAPKILDYFVLIYKPSHPRSMGEGYVPEQYLVAEKALGRMLTEDEDVRHINGNAQDNRPTNLEIISTNSYYKVQAIEDDLNDRPSSKRSSKTFISCRYQRPCWKTVRGPMAKREGVYLPYLCSWQMEGDIYKCSHFWKFLSEEMNSDKEKDDSIAEQK